MLYITYSVTSSSFSSTVACHVPGSSEDIDCRSGDPGLPGHEVQGGGGPGELVLELLVVEVLQSSCWLGVQVHPREGPRRMPALIQGYWPADGGFSGEGSQLGWAALWVTSPRVSCGGEVSGPRGPCSSPVPCVLTAACLSVPASGFWINRVWRSSLLSVPGHTSLAARCPQSVKSICLFWSF